jgi:hypothetical protein
VLLHPVADQPDAAGEVVAVDHQLVPTLSTVVSSPEPPKSRRWPWKLETSLDGWIRPGSSASARLGFRGALAWGPMVAEISYRPATTLETASTRAIGGAVGAECNLYASRWLLLDLRGVVDFERQSAAAASAPFPPNSPMPSPGPKEGPQQSPAPPPSNPEHAWMVGPAASVRLGVPIVLGMRVGISLDVRWMFATELLANNPAWSQGLDLGAAFFAGWAI